MSDLFTFSGDRALAGAVLRYRVMAYVVGTALLVLTTIVILQYGFHQRSDMKTPEMIVAPIHGYLYIVYLVTAADLARRARWGIGRIVLVVCSGFVPFLAFIIEHRVYQPDAGGVGGRGGRSRGARVGDARCRADPDRTRDLSVPQRAPRTRVPGRAPVSVPSANVVTPDLMVSTYPTAPWSRRLPPAGRSSTTRGLPSCRRS